MKLFYFLLFLILSYTLYRLCVFVPPVGGENGYLLYCIKSAGISIIVSAVAIYGLFRLKK